MITDAGSPPRVPLPPSSPPLAAASHRPDMLRRRRFAPSRAPALKLRQLPQFFIDYNVSIRVRERLESSIHLYTLLIVIELRIE